VEHVRLAEVAYPARVMIVHGPPAIRDDVRKGPPRLNVALGDDVVSDVAAALALAGQEPDPVQNPVLRAVVAAVLHMIPYAVDDLEQVVPQHFGVVNGVGLAPEFDPPPVRAGERVVAVRDLFVRGVDVRPVRRHKCLRAVRLASLQEEAHPHRVAIGDLGGDGFAEL